MHPDLPEHAARHLAEHILHQIKPRTVLGNEDEQKALRPTRQVALRLLRDVGGVIVENEAQRRGRRIGGIQLFQELNEVLALMRLADDLGDCATVQIQTRQQRNDSQSFVFVVRGRAGMVPGQGRPVGRFLRP